MEFARPLSDLVKDLWGLASTPLGYIYNLNDNVRLLDEANVNLKAVSEDVKATVEREEEEAHARRTDQVANWLDKVQLLLWEVDQVLQDAGDRDRIKCLSRCLPRNCWSSYTLGKGVYQLLNKARQFQHERGELGDFTSLLPPPQVLEMPLDKTVGLDCCLDIVWKWLVDEEQVGVIGLYGKGGVGKTTLMKRINKKLLHANLGFEVIWVVVSKQRNEDRIRDTIRKSLRIQDESWDQWSPDERVDRMCYVLNQKKFVLLVDDVWAWLDLSKIGVPHPCLENGSKVVFTTRSKDVCDHMRANKTHEVQCLKPKEALTLFMINVGKSLENCDQEIQDLAEDIVEECKGLPLALTTVGRAMASRENSREWRYALTTLKKKPHELSGMEEVYYILKFSYNSLNNSIIKRCFLYCCLFPEDYPIRTNSLIELWIGEGLLGDIDDVYKMRDKGEFFLGTLRMACLLESENVYGEGECVKMHDVIRDMATWIACDYGQKENKLLVIENQEDMSREMISKWRKAQEVSLWGKWIRNINHTPPMCSRLKTLFVRETNVKHMPQGFFDLMTARLTVLDMSGNRCIKSFPEEICNLINLRYLNLSYTYISALPRKIKNLTRLRWLLVDCATKNFLIPTGVIASLQLKVFSQWVGTNLVKEEEVVEELGGMQSLADLSITVNKSSSALKIFESFHICIRRVAVKNCEDLTQIPISHSLEGSGNFLHLEVLHLDKCPMLMKMEITQGIGRASCFPSLVEVSVDKCRFLDLSWLVHAPKLQRLTIAYCNSMEKVIGDGIAREELADSRLFSRLKYLDINDLSKLRSICDHTLFFSQGVELRIVGCPGLRKLPLDSNSVRGSFSIAAEQHVWAEFEWDPAARVTAELIDSGKFESMTFGEAARRMKEYPCWAQIEFLPRESRE